MSNIALTTAALFIGLSSPVMADPYGAPLAWVRGSVCAIYDGDTFAVCSGQSRIDIRLRGVNAPEVRGEERPLGLTARDWLRMHWLNRDVVCALLGPSIDRMVADCWGLDDSLGASIVNSGTARACPAYGGGYVTRPEAESLPDRDYCE